MWSSKGAVFRHRVRRVGKCRVGVSDDDMDYYAGVGLGYDFSPQFSMGVAYDLFGVELESDNGIDENLDTDVFWVTGELRFQ